MLWVVTFSVMLLCVAGMAVGVMAGRKPIAGSCGGIGAMGADASCSLCGGNPNKCEESKQETGSTAPPALGYDATQRK
ncbi:(Na+)-NQR maturation NqrM [Pseudomonas sp. MYb185]|uniref:(Na+)-NQR maturation NqrM n=1 Tax=Pseudomonas sp. MYb185 TaxID=1848729 RepID=UPI000CFE0BCD|nr:(Na+)-NQR maturation NqrM [Pseudomonas sp. MYb185]PRB82198.1 ApbE family protein [Pseudomonas sp. MYb185]